MPIVVMSFEPGRKKQSVLGGGRISMENGDIDEWYMKLCSLVACKKVN